MMRRDHLHMTVRSSTWGCLDLRLRTPQVPARGRSGSSWPRARRRHVARGRVRAERLGSASARAHGIEVEFNELSRALEGAALDRLRPARASRERSAPGDVLRSQGDHNPHDDRESTDAQAESMRSRERHDDLSALVTSSTRCAHRRTRQRTDLDQAAGRCADSSSSAWR